MGFYDIGIVQAIKDFSNFFKFRKMMRREFKIRDSKFNKYNLKYNWLGNIVYVQINCTDEDFMNAYYDAEKMLEMKLAPIVTYLSSELSWGDYLTPQISNFVDDDNNPTLSYGVLFIFTGYKLTMTGAIFGLLGLLSALGVGIWAIFRFLV